MNKPDFPCNNGVILYDGRRRHAHPASIVSKQGMCGGVLISATFSTRMIISTEKPQEWCIPFIYDIAVGVQEELGRPYRAYYKVWNPISGAPQDPTGLDKHSILFLWGDERSSVYPSVFQKAVKAVIKCHCPETWTQRGIIPITDGFLSAPPPCDTPARCSTRAHNVFFSANLNKRRLDLYRGLSGKSFGYPCKISACYPTNGSQPFLHQVEATLMQKIINRWGRQKDFSAAYPESYIRFTQGFAAGLQHDEYWQRLFHSKISWCPPGFITNETIRLLESAYAGCVAICGQMPKLPMYEGHPFIEIKDWRKIRSITDELLHDEARMDELGSKARMWYDSHFSVEAQIKRIAAKIKEAG